MHQREKLGCWSWLEAQLVLCKVSNPTEYTWHTIISGCAALGESKEALRLYHLMLRDCTNPGKLIFLCILKVCATIGIIEHGKSVHDDVIRNGLKADLFVASALIYMYSNCGDVSRAREVFDSLLDRNVVLWNAMIAGYVQHGNGLCALKLFEGLQESALKPNKVTFSCVLKACGDVLAIEQGKFIHDQIIQESIDSDVFVGSALIDMYAKCGKLKEARQVFNELPSRNLVSWNAMISGYAQHGDGLSALELFEEMGQKDLKPDKHGFSSVLTACGSIEALGPGKIIHNQIFENGAECDIVVGNSLVDMYARCGSLKEACNVFDSLLNRDRLSFSALIAGCGQHGACMLALELFDRMQAEGIKPGKLILLNILKSCANLGAFELAKTMHEKTIKHGLELDMVVGSALVHMYAKCGSLEEAFQVFDELPRRDVVSWNSMIAGYCQHGQGLDALRLIKKMQKECIRPDQFTISCSLKACGSVGAIEQGKHIHDQIRNSALESDIVIGNSVADMYMRCGGCEEARAVFNKMPERNIVSWGAILTGYAQHGHGLLALDLFEEMQDISLDKDLCISLLKACSNVSAVGMGKLLHDEVTRSGLDRDALIGNSLIDMYKSCGSVNEAQKVFEELPNQTVGAWGSLMARYAEHVNSGLAEQLFKILQERGLKPDCRAFTSALSSCSHAGNAEKGYQYFKSIREGHDLETSTEHFYCLVGLFCSVGCLSGAMDILHTMPPAPNLTGWISLLAACRTYQSTELARHCFKQSATLDSNSAAAYVLMSNVYAEGHHYKECLKVQDLRRCASA